MTENSQTPRCSRRLFLVGSATTVAGAFLAACGKPATAEIAATQVPVGSAVIVDKLIIAQPTEGEFLAYSTVCPHQGNPISQVNGDTVRCPAHGSSFDIATGEPVEGPAQSGMTPAPVRQEGDTVVAGGE
ncbi:Rieske 2Fe-2S domain-containing protein [Corynebacterium genitalium ATCC 33030]|uniref:Tat pathway signal sequence domain protein n=1 Tax=Corynebacterium genitalium ATCC 33030 TaxID=585529 RepID=D7W971_9CORY|nr:MULTISPECIES: Rieske (2Fe-2S) protein [Corynebacterium]EFK55351.1 Tat pathway signal sequence domain protein [Corynebacterium genitalium ATCC 33030]MCQ4620077.1 Rieske 2Fe-2S domain-containing protein [Corynebacterium sp. CCUG 71335]MCQ4624343.1 Rieske 2Fe-2S domain-containing protein [Corynebacterium sp. CCUG 69979]MCQ4626867.1 Rieske 2Fe-2S domain-containing protein [Corynebacterium sp. CCUG 65737]UUA89401.1 Rieske 2Fe-2S domain-containing protein [Corynebacterium genitalium ATCC 33030]